MDDKKKKDKHEHEPGVVKGVFQTYRAEFRKIVWPSKQTLFKHTVTVIVVSLIFGAYIALFDYVFSIGFREFVDAVHPDGITEMHQPPMEFEMFPEDMFELDFDFE